MNWPRCDLVDFYLRWLYRLTSGYHLLWRECTEALAYLPDPLPTTPRFRERRGIRDGEGATRQSRRGSGGPSGSRTRRADPRVARCGARQGGTSEPFEHLERLKPTAPPTRPNTNMRHVGGHRWASRRSRGCVQAGNFEGIVHELAETSRRVARGQQVVKKVHPRRMKRITEGGAPTDVDHATDVGGGSVLVRRAEDDLLVRRACAADLLRDGDLLAPAPDVEGPRGWRAWRGWRWRGTWSTASVGQLRRANPQLRTVSSAGLNPRRPHLLGPPLARLDPAALGDWALSNARQAAPERGPNRARAAPKQHLGRRSRCSHKKPIWGGF